MKKLFAFTLAEVLITLAIIGVVAALTIPTLIVNNQEKGWNTAATVFERKLEESLKVMNTQGTLAGYRTTEAFVNELQKHLKITKVCKNDDLMSCFEDKVMFGAGEAEPEEVDMSKITTSKHFGQDDWGTNILGLQLANGTSALIAYNPECKQDPYSNQITGTSCLAVLYDTSGYAKPNTSGKDLRALNVASLGSKCAFEINGTCYGAPFFPTPHVWKGCNTSGVTTNEEDLKFMSDHGITYCLRSDLAPEDYWAGAVAACGHVDKMPTQAQLSEIADYIYNTSGLGTGYESKLTRDDKKASSLGFTNFTSSTAFYVWSGEERNPRAAYFRNFYPNSTYTGDCRGRSDIQVVCIN